jgi:hypothetical protein
MLRQCMNGLDVNQRMTPPTKRSRTLFVRLKTRVTIRTKRRACSKHLTILGTPDTTPKKPIITDPKIESTDKPNGKPNQEMTKTTKNVEDIDLYYRIFDRFRPEQGESNAESAARHDMITAEYNLRVKQKRDSTCKSRTTLSPSRPLVRPLPRRATKMTTPIVEALSSQTNNAQEIQLQTEHSLYANPDQPRHTNVEIIYDTGAAISMMSAQHTHAWTNLRPCLHTLTGCFTGRNEPNLQMS